MRSGPPRCAAPSSRSVPGSRRRCGGWRRWSRARPRRPRSSRRSGTSARGCSAPRTSGWCATRRGPASSSWRAPAGPRSASRSALASRCAATTPPHACSRPGCRGGSTTTRRQAHGPIAEAERASGLHSVVAVPIRVEGRLWGAMGVGSQSDLPPDTESRLGHFTDLMATAIANTESHARADRLADEQAALRRVATLVAEGAPPSAVLDAVAAEMEALLDADQVALNRFEPGDEMVVLAHRGLDVDRTPVGSRREHRGRERDREGAAHRATRADRPRRVRGRRSSPSSHVRPVCARASRRRSRSKAGCGA